MNHHQRQNTKKTILANSDLTFKGAFKATLGYYAAQALISVSAILLITVVVAVVAD